MKNYCFLLLLALVTVVLKANAQCTFSLTGTVTDASCYNGMDGNINVTVTGGTPPFSFQWNNGITLAVVTGDAGTYILTVTDMTGCSAADTFTITEPAQLSLTINVDSSQLGIWTLTPLVTGGTTPYAYQWSTAGTETVLTAPPGVYTVTVIDANGCTDMSTVSVGQNSCGPLFTASYDTLNNQFNLILDSIVQAQFSLGDFSWDFGDGTTSTSQFPSHSYANNNIYNVCLTVVNAVGSCDYCHNISIDSTGNVITRIDLTGFNMQVVPHNYNGIHESVPMVFNFYPNPVIDVALVTFDTNVKTSYSVNIHNVIGQSVKAITFDANLGNNIFHLLLSDLAAGVYVLSVGNHAQRATRTFVK